MTFPIAQYFLSSNGVGDKIAPPCKREPLLDIHCFAPSFKAKQFTLICDQIPCEPPHTSKPSVSEIKELYN